MSQTIVVRAYEELADFFARSPSTDEIMAFRLSNETVERLRELLYKNSAGTLASDESDELDQVQSLNRLLMLIRSRIPLDNSDTTK
ncbi:MAG TPA: hypothetical protein VMV29_07745 [Ktedonobacterales bacterium]|nr:hypothetical protein [Ktedonobacterales bacterium]